MTEHGFSDEQRARVRARFDSLRAEIGHHTSSAFGSWVIGVVREHRVLYVEPPTFTHDATLSGNQVDTLVLDAADGAPSNPEAITATLTAGIADVTQSLASGEFKLNEVLRMVLETMQRALSLQRVVFCLRDPKTDTITGRMALGAGGQAACKPFAIALREKAGVPVDLFAAVCRKGADTVITDTTRGGMAARLPPWYVQGVNAPSFLLLPLMMRNAPFGLIYADAARPGGIAPEEKELVLLRALRNQVVMAFRQVDRG